MGNLSIRKLEFSYADAGGFRLRIPELHVAPGEQIAIVGPSGSGKTTLLNLVAGTLLPASGEIRLAETCVNRLSETARRRFRLEQVGQVFQAFELLSYLTVEENILLPRLIDPAASVDDSIRQRARELVESVGLSGKAQRLPVRLSHGERQRVAVCRALLNRPRLLLADEPTGNLDQVNKQAVVDLLAEQARVHSSTLLMVTHDRSLLGSFGRVFDFSELAHDEDPGGAA